MNYPALSLVVCTRNRGNQLAQMLASLERQDCAQNWELVLVDNHSTDNTASVIRDFIEDTSLDVSSQYCSEPGLSRARNCGWRAARGEVVAFTDDDCYPKDDFVAEIIAAFAKGDCDFVGGKVSLYDSEDYPITIQTSNQTQEYPPHSYIQPGAIAGCNMSFKRQVLEVIQGFDERMGAGTSLHAGEDTDALMAALSCGFCGKYVPEVEVAHHHGRKTLEEVNRLKVGYDRGRGALYAKGLLSRPRKLRTLKAWTDSALYRLIHKGELTPTLRELAGAISLLMTRKNSGMSSLTPSNPSK